MNSSRTLLLPLLAAALCAGASEPVAVDGAELGVWTQDYAAATNAAAASGKPVFLDFTGSDWCGWCMLMENKVFSTDAWKAWAATNLYLVTLDFPHDKSIVPEKYKDRNDELKKEHGVHGYPTYVVLDSQGKRLGRLGANRNATPGKFIRELCGVLGIDPPASAASAPADPAAKRFVDALVDAKRELKEKAQTISRNPTVGQLKALLDDIVDTFGALDTEGVPENLAAAFRSNMDAMRAVRDELAKLDPSDTAATTLRPDSNNDVKRAFDAEERAEAALVEAAEACGIENAADLLLH